jgi:hypothetical protein
MVPKVYGIDRTIRELKQVEPTAIKGVRKDLRSAAEPIATTIYSALPSEAPIRGMRHKGRTGWDKSAIKAKVKTDFSRKASNRGYAIVSIWVGGRRAKKGQAPVRGTAALQMADMAGRGKGFKTPSGKGMIQALSDSPSRYVWKKAEQQIPQISAEILLSLEKTSAKINKNLVVK